MLNQIKRNAMIFIRRRPASYDVGAKKRKVPAQGERTCMVDAAIRSTLPTRHRRHGILFHAVDNNGQRRILL